MWRYYVLKIISKTVCLLPASLKKVLGVLVGRIFWLCLSPWRKTLAVKQICDCLGLDRDAALAVARASVTKIGPMVVEMLCFPLLDKDNIRSKVVLNNEELWRSLFKGDKGLIIMTAHFGNWELMGAAVALYGYPLVAVAKKIKVPAIDKFINEYRSMVGEHVTYQSGVLEMARMIGKGYAIGLLSDQDGGPDGVTVDFFGKPTSCPKGAAALARLTNVPLVLALIRTNSDGTNEIDVHQPIYVEHTPDREKDIEVATAFLMKKLEGEIRKNPAMWAWSYNRWKVERAELQNN